MSDYWDDAICPEENDADDFEDEDEELILSAAAMNFSAKTGSSKDTPCLSPEFIAAAKNYKVIHRINPQVWLDQIEEHYIGRQEDLVRQCMQSALSNVEDVFTLVLHVLDRGFFDLYSKQVPLAWIMLEEFDVWVQTRRISGKGVPYPSTIQQNEAMAYLCKRGYNYLEKMSKLFQLRHGDNQFLAKHINIESLSAKRLKEVVNIVIIVGLQHCFDAKQIMLPLIACDQIQVLEEYVGDDVHLQKEYAGILHELCAMKAAELEVVKRSFAFQVKDESKFTHKTLMKMAEKVIKKYSLPVGDYPNVFQEKNLASLKYVLRKKYGLSSKDSEGVEEKWDHLIEAAVRDNVWLQQQLLLELLEWRDLPSAIRWAKLLGMPRHAIPPSVLDALGDGYEGSFEKVPSATADDRLYEDDQASSCSSDAMKGAECEELATNSEDWDQELSGAQSTSWSLFKDFTPEGEIDESQCLELSIPMENIHIIDTTKLLLRSTKAMFKNGNVVGFDAEWKPTVGRAGEKERVAIIQVATRNEVFIVDLFKLCALEDAEDALRSFFRLLFTSKFVVKLGFGVAGDLKMLTGMFSYLTDFILKSTKFVDLCDLSQKILPLPAVQPYLHDVEKGDLADRGLSLFVNRVLGKKLNKAYQLSDWERRPLSDKQIKYAALDALCLISAYDRLVAVVKETSVKVNMTENVKLKWLKRTRNNQKRKDKYDKRTSSQSTLPISQPVVDGDASRSPSSLKVICDTMLEGLGRYLRQCGVDAEILAPGDDHSKAIKLSNMENRVILTQGRPFFKLRRHVAEGMCMWVPEGSLVEQMQMIFIRYKIALKSEDIFSRCTLCNCSQFVDVHRNDMKPALAVKNNRLPADSCSTSDRVGVVALNSCSVLDGLKLQMDAGVCQVLENVIDCVEVFFCCAKCGKIYWKGSHFDRLEKQLVDFINPSLDTRTSTC